MKRIIIILLIVGACFHQSALSQISNDIKIEAGKYTYLSINYRPKDSYPLNLFALLPPQKQIEFGEGDISDFIDTLYHSSMFVPHIFKAASFYKLLWGKDRMANEKAEELYNEIDNECYDKYYEKAPKHLIKFNDGTVAKYYYYDICGYILILDSNKYPSYGSSLGLPYREYDWIKNIYIPLTVVYYTDSERDPLILH